MDQVKARWPELHAADLACAGRAFGLERVEHAGHAKLVEVALRAFGGEARGRFYVETLAPVGRVPRPDLVVCHPRLGCLVIECKGVPIGAVAGVEGTTLTLRRAGGMSAEDPFAQAEKVAFRLKDLVSARLRRGLPIFVSAVALPLIERDEFVRLSGVTLPPQTFFADAFASPESFEAQARIVAEAARERAGRKTLWFRNGADEIERVFRGHAPLQAARPTRLEDAETPGAAETLGLRIEREGLADALPTSQQHAIAEKDLRGEHWLFRGVAGSGKSVMLAMNAAKTLFGLTVGNGGGAGLFDAAGASPRVLVCCFNRSLVAFLRGRVEERYRRLAYDDPPAGSLVVTHFDGLLSDLRKAEPALPQRASNELHHKPERAAKMTAAFDALPAERRASLGFDAIYVDEAQDLHPSEFGVLLRLCRPVADGSGTLVIFYDNAQNIYGQPTPTWSDLGVRIVGRTTFLDDCFRNTRQTLELAFNVLVGAAAPQGRRVTTRRFADVANLEQRRLVEERGDGFYRVTFARRGDGPTPRVLLFGDRAAEAAGVAEMVGRLVRDEGVLPSDVLVLAASPAGFADLERRLRDAVGPNFGVRVIDKRHDANKDAPLIAEGTLTLSTVASAKGYDAAVTILMGVDRIDADDRGRATFYVGATRAKHALMLCGVAARGEPAAGLLGEVVAVAAALGGEAERPA